MSKAMTQPSAARARNVAFCGLSIALMAVAAWVTVPFGPVPFTLQTLAVMFVLFALPPKQALAAIGGYLVLGAIGLPVFSSFKGGLAALMGPTGGFIVGFFVAGAIALCIDALVKRTPLFASEKEASFFGAHMAAGRLARNLVMGVVFLAGTRLREGALGRFLFHHPPVLPARLLAASAAESAGSRTAASHPACRWLCALRLLQNVRHAHGSGHRVHRRTSGSPKRSAAQA